MHNRYLSNEDYLFLTIKTVYLYQMKSGDKNVEYREPGNFIFSRLYHNYAANHFSKPKKLSHILFQAGYNPDSPRMLIELKGWNNQGINVPNDLNAAHHDIDDDLVNLILGKIIFENLDMSREEEFLNKEDRVYGTPVKSAKAKAILKSKLSNRKAKINANLNKKK